MRILKISDVYFPRINGVSTSIETFRRELAGLGHRISLIAPDYGQRLPDEEAIVRIPSRTVAFDPEDRFMSPRAVRELGARLAESGCDLVHVHTPFVAHYTGIALAQRLGVPVVETYHTYFEEYLHHYLPLVPAGITRWLARRFSRSQCNHVDAVVVPSAAMLAVLRDYGVAQRAEVIPTGIEMRDFAGGDGKRFRERFGIDPERPVLLTVSRLAHEKNIGFLLRVAKRVSRAIPQTLLVVTGEGPARRALQAEALRLGLADNTLFIGYLDRRDGLPDAYQAADAFVFASRTETQGLVLLEAMACGTPVVSTAVLGTRDVLRAGAGCLIAREDEEDFAEKAVALLRDADLRARLSAAALDYAASWSSGAMARRMAGLYGSLVDTPAAPAPAS